MVAQSLMATGGSPNRAVGAGAGSDGSCL